MVSYLLSTLLSGVSKNGVKPEGSVQAGPYRGQKYTISWASHQNPPRWESVWLDDGFDYPVERDVRIEVLEYL